MFHTWKCLGAGGYECRGWRIKDGHINKPTCKHNSDSECSILLEASFPPLLQLSKGISECQSAFASWDMWRWKVWQVLIYLFFCIKKKKKEAAYNFLDFISSPEKHSCWRNRCYFLPLTAACCMPPGSSFFLIYFLVKHSVGFNFFNHTIVH